MNWTTKKTLVTGGASFIGSNLVDALLERGTAVRVVDNLRSGKLENIQQHIDSGAIEFIEGDLRGEVVASRAVEDMDVVFHLAAVHGGRGFLDRHQAACSTNLALDGTVFASALNANVDKVVYASSGCVYPNFLQSNPDQESYLSENMVGPPYDADNMYGWAKLMAEMTLKAYHDEWGLKTASCRYFTVYGERGLESHALIAMIARAFVEQDPFEVWGTGMQIRNWTYVGDIVEGTIRVAENIDDGTAVNLGTQERTRVIDAVRQILSYTGHDAEIKLLTDMPTGPYNRVASNKLAKELLGWQPEVEFTDGLHRTIDWYYVSHDRDYVRENLQQLLTAH